MWRNKKPDTPQAADPEQKSAQTNQPPRPATESWEGTTKMNNDVVPAAGAIADRATARLGSSLHVKGEVSGNEDLLIEGSLEGLVQLDERRLTVGATAKLTADIIAGELIVYGSVKGNVHGKRKIEIKKDGSLKTLGVATVSSAGCKASASPAAHRQTGDTAIPCPWMIDGVCGSNSGRPDCAITSGLPTTRPETRFSVRRTPFLSGN
jgi:hypothetical protein